MTDKSTHELSQEISDFLTRYIDSVEQLEIILLLNSTHPKAWTSAEISAHLHSTTQSIDQRLSDLEKDHLISTSNGQFAYNTSDPLRNKLMLKLADEYKNRRIRIIEFIFSKPNKKIRSFLNAFKLRKDE